MSNLVFLEKFIFTSMGLPWRGLFTPGQSLSTTAYLNTYLANRLCYKCALHMLSGTLIFLNPLIASPIISRIGTFFKKAFLDTNYMSKIIHNFQMKKNPMHCGVSPTSKRGQICKRGARNRTPVLSAYSHRRQQSRSPNPPRD